MPAAIKNSSTPTALFGAISGLIVVLGLNLGIDIGPELAAAIVMVAAGIISLLNPRWAQARGIFVKRPAAWSGAAATILVALAPLAGVELNAQEAASLVAVVIALVGANTPISDPA
jgi:hypothetical protein